MRLPIRILPALLLGLPLAAEQPFYPEGAAERRFTFSGSSHVLSAEFGRRDDCRGADVGVGGAYFRSSRRAEAFAWVGFSSVGRTYAAMDLVVSGGSLTKGGLGAKASAGVYLHPHLFAGLGGMAVAGIRRSYGVAYLQWGYSW